MRSLRYLNMILTVLAVLLALQLWTAWVNAPSSTAQAQTTGGGIPDAGAQRNQIIDVLKRISQQTDDLTTFLKAGQLRAKMEMPRPDSKNGG